MLLKLSTCARKHVLWFIALFQSNVDAYLLLRCSFLVGKKTYSNLPKHRALNFVYPNGDSLFMSFGYEYYHCLKFLRPSPCSRWLNPYIRNISECLHMSYCFYFWCAFYDSILKYFLCSQCFIPPTTENVPESRLHALPKNFIEGRRKRHGAADEFLLWELDDGNARGP